MYIMMEINKYNESTSRGTLAFMDNVVKYNATKYFCDTITGDKEFKNLIYQKETLQM